MGATMQFLRSVGIAAVAFMLVAATVVLVSQQGAQKTNPSATDLPWDDETQLNFISKLKGKIHKTVKRAAPVVAKAVHTAKTDVDNAVHTVVQDVDSMLTPDAICEEVVKMASGKVGSKEILKLSEGSGGEDICAELRAEAGADTDAVSGGPEDPVGDAVAAALGLNCEGLCSTAIEEAISPGTSAFAEYICHK